MDLTHNNLKRSSILFAKKGTDSTPFIIDLEMS